MFIINWTRDSKSILMIHKQLTIYFKVKYGYIIGYY